MGVDDKSVADSLHARMRKAGIDTSYYLLPVVDVNNNLTIRPKTADILAEYNAYAQ